jgi:hypothetical protein
MNRVENIPVSKIRIVNAPGRSRSSTVSDSRRGAMQSFATFEMGRLV